MRAPGSNGSSRPRRAARCGLVVLAAGLVVACTPAESTGGGPDAPIAEATAVPGDEGTPTDPDAPVALNRTVAYSGMLLTLGTGEFQGSEKSYDRKLVVSAEVENPTDEDLTFLSSGIALEDDATEVAVGLVRDSLKVLARAKANTAIEFSLRKPLDRSKVALVMGRRTQQQVRVPLSASAGEFVSLLPVELVAPAPFPVGPLTMAVDWARVDYAGLGVTHEPAPRGKAYVTMNVRLRGRASLVSVGSRGITLALPDGTTVPASELRQNYQNKKDEETEARVQFTVPAGLGGQARFAIAMDSPTGARGSTVLELKADGAPPPPGGGGGSGGGGGDEDDPTPPTTRRKTQPA